MRKFITIVEALNPKHVQPRCVWQPTLDDGFELVGEKDGTQYEKFGVIYVDDCQFGVIYVDDCDNYLWVATEPGTGKCLKEGGERDPELAKRAIEAVHGLPVCSDRCSVMESLNPKHAGDLYEWKPHSDFEPYWYLELKGEINDGRPFVAMTVESDDDVEWYYWIGHRKVHGGNELTIEAAKRACEKHLGLLYCRDGENIRLEEALNPKHVKPLLYWYNPQLGNCLWVLEPPNLDAAEGRIRTYASVFNSKKFSPAPFSWRVDQLNRESNGLADTQDEAKRACEAALGLGICPDDPEIANRPLPLKQRVGNALRAAVGLKARDA